MRPKERRDSSQSDFFRARLDQIVDMGHPLAKLAATIDGRFLEERSGAVYSDKPGHPPLRPDARATRLLERPSARSQPDDPGRAARRRRPVVCTEMWPGNTADVGSLIPAIDRLQRRFRINRVCVVADRGMISAETIAELEARRLPYVRGVRERTDKLVRELVLGDPAPFVPFVLRKERREVDWEAK